VSQVDNKENWSQLDQEFERNEKGLHGRATWKSVPKWTDTNIFCRPLDGFYRNGVGKPFRFAVAHQLYILEGLLSSEYRYSHQKAAWFCPLHTTSSSKQSLYVAKTHAPR